MGGNGSVAGGMPSTRAGVCVIEDAIRAAIDLGGDTDTVAAVTGGLAGAYYGLDAIPDHWTQPLHVPLPGFDGQVLRLGDLLRLARRLEEGPR
ncbi:ADP-ribosylglycohydrolase family protein [Streptomyces sp. NPDC058398]|uniref:ADP-ribosylglycohydrolase family protein n=1 Tax=Streptomyces sp. NPDC058398 TaxID=3346479 RepID=UPI0036462C42